jgi:hypothetical protein
MSQKKWVLEIYRRDGSINSLVSTRDFDDLPSVRTAIVQNRDMAFIVREPPHAVTQDRATLLDLRAQGFNIALGSPRLP